MPPYRILLAEEHALFREGIKRILESDPDLEMVGEVGDGIHLLESLKTSVPDMIILGISLPRLSGLEALERIKSDYPRIKILVLSMHRSRGHLLRALSGGADGYLLKGNTYHDLFAAIESIRKENIYISNLIAEQILDLVLLKTAELPKRTLTPKERVVLQLLCQGKTSKQIAAHLNVSLPTVQSHRANLKKKLKIGSTAGLIKYALQKGFATPEYD